MHEHDFAGEPLGLAEIVGGHYHLDAARGDLADHVLDRLGRGGIEARGRLIEQEDLRFLGERACERKPLLLAAGELARWPALEPGQTDERAELEGTGSAPRARHAGGGERIADVAGGAAAQHSRPLEHHGAMRGRRLLPAAPGHTPACGQDQPHDEPQQRGLAGAVRADQHGGRSGHKRKRDALEDRHAAGGEAHVFEHYRQIGDGRAHGHPANRSPARRKPQAVALTTTTMAISTRPSPMASGRSPFEVSSAIAVVMVRVKPSMLPPTMSTAPTSAAARPKPASSAVTRLKRASKISVATRPAGPRRIAVSSSRYSAHKSSIVWRVSAATMGATRIICATTMACGVNNSPHDPRGPERDSAR